jgi:adenosylcobinamide-phosphate synthase
MDGAWPSLPTETSAQATAAAFAAVAVLTAWWWDARFGEPPNALHPVAWLGRLLGPLGALLVRWPAGPALAGGAVAWCLIAAALGWMAAALESILAQCAAASAQPVLWSVPAAVACGVLLKPCLAWRMLHDEVLAVDRALATSLQAGRDRVARLSSRDVQALDEAGVRETAIETLAENLNDSVVAPLFWFVVAGLPGAVVYRFANTCDAMWGYRGRWEWAGKWAARTDDVLSWLPARITAAVLAPCWCFGHGARLRREAIRTPSPNGGWPMAAMALYLGVRLRKPGVYTLNADAPSPGPVQHAQALQHAQAATRVVLGLAVAAAAVLPLLRSALAGWLV